MVKKKAAKKAPKKKADGSEDFTLVDEPDDPGQPLNIVDEASMESFPASDPPARSPITRP